MTLATKYRPTTFDEVVGHSYIKDILNNQIKNNRYVNTYLFCGPSGIGKTTIARIFGNKLTNGEPVIEYNGSNMTGVEDARELEVQARKAPLVGENKVFILDEAHRLTGNAWDSMLKLLEEPPANTIFIFCTTDPHKIPSTIISRLQVFEFLPPNEDEILDKLLDICSKEATQQSNREMCEAIISKTTNIREAISILEKSIEYGCCSDFNFNRMITQIIGVPPKQVFIELDNAIDQGDVNSILINYKNLVDSGISITTLVNLHMNYLIDNYLENGDEMKLWMINSLVEVKKHPIDMITIKAILFQNGVLGK